MTVLDFTRASGHNHTHFDHQSGGAVSFSPDKAARLLPAYYSFVSIGGRGYKFSVNQLPPYYAVIKGPSLFHTLINSLLPLEAIGLVLDDPPVLWRRNDTIKGDIEKISWMQAMMFPARRITLIPEEDCTVRWTYHSQGECYLNPDGWTDPYVSYRIGNGGRKPVCPKESIAIWRNISEMVDLPGKTASPLLNSYCSIHNDSYMVDILLFGVEIEDHRAKYLKNYRHTLSLPLSCMRSEQIIDRLRQCIRLAERVEKVLERQLDYDFESGKVKYDFESGKVKNENRIASLSGQSAKAAIQSYYEDCKTLFWEICYASQNSENLFDDVNAFRNSLLPLALKAFDCAFSGKQFRIKTLKIVEERRQKLYFTLKKEVSL